MTAMPHRSHDEWLQILKQAPVGIIPGSTEEVLRQAEIIKLWFTREKVVQEGSHVLDLGCGTGRLAIALSDVPVTYVGLDVVSSCIEFCQRTFAPWKNFSFVHHDIRNNCYNPNGLIEHSAATLPFPSKEFDSVAAISVFTHIGTAQARDQHLKEVHRVLRPGGQFFCTWFRSPPNAVTSDESRAVFPEQEILNAIRNFRILHEEGGKTTEHHDQWSMLLQSKE
jgi:ubiquinone/menaquinone biosynthesis C-methylase UbiE